MTLSRSAHKGMQIAIWLACAAGTANFVVAQFAECSTGEDLTRVTVQLALFLYAGSLIGMLHRGDPSDDRRRRQEKITRWLWSAAFGVYFVHVLLAFHYFHHWSHAAAFVHVVRESGFGPGLYFNYAFTLTWAADVVYWWCGIDRYARRRRWITAILHGFMLFMIVNGAVIFAHGTTRWINLLLFAVVAVHAIARLVPADSRCEESRSLAIVVGWVIGGVVGLVPGLAVAIYHGSFMRPADDDFHRALLFAGSIFGLVLGGLVALWLHWRREHQSVVNRS